MKSGEKISLNGSEFRLPKKFGPHYTRARIVLGRYERSENMFVKKYLNPTLDTVELGVGIGVVTSSILSTLKPDAGYFGVEANPELVQLANENFAFREKLGTTVFENCMIGAESTALDKEFYVTTDNFHFSAANKPEGNYEKIYVPMISLSELIERHDLREYQLVADVEGAEFEILTSDIGSMTNCSNVIIELHNTKNSTGELLSIGNIVELFNQNGFQKVDRNEDVFNFVRR